MLYNIIGDIHGRDDWKKLVREDAINIFVGDYYSPYDKNISFEDCRKNFLEIVQYKLEHPDNVILLIGNHDEDHWHIREGYSRFDGYNWSLIKDTFEECQKIKEDIFQVAYSIENKALVTHAGVSYVWYERYKNHTISWLGHNCNYDDPDFVESPYTHEKVPYENPMKFSLCKTPEEAYFEWMNKAYKNWAPENKNPKEGEFIIWHDTLWRYNKEVEKFEEFNITPNEVAEFVNKLWKEDKKYSAFNFRSNCGPNDYYGDDERHGPMWIRPEALKSSNIFMFKDYWQFFGHTQRLIYNKPGSLNYEQLENLLIDKKNKLVYCDCQSYGPISILYDNKTNEVSLNII